jgi:hypothetical protein
VLFAFFGPLVTAIIRRIADLENTIAAVLALIEERQTAGE